MIRLYTIPLSPPGESIKLALRRKGAEHRVVDLLGGLHPAALRALGFAGVTVPAAKLADGRRVQGSLEIMRALEELPGPALYPGDPGRRAAVEDAERWGEGTLQPMPRRIVRWGLRAHLRQRRWFADVATPLPLPAVAGLALTPLVPLFVRQAGAYDEQVRADVATLPAHLDHVDALIADGVIGDAAAPNAADLQLAGALAMLHAFAELRPLFAGRPCARLAALVPDYPPIPAALPPGWVPAAA